MKTTLIKLVTVLGTATILLNNPEVAELIPDNFVEQSVEALESMDNELDQAIKEAKEEEENHKKESIKEAKEYISESLQTMLNNLSMESENNY